MPARNLAGYIVRFFLVATIILSPLLPVPGTADKISYEVGDILAVHGKVWFSLPRIGALAYTEASGCTYKVTLNRSAFPGRIQPDALTVDRAGHVWFADLLAHRVGYISDKRIENVPLPKDVLPIISLAGSSDGSVWAAPEYGREIIQLKNGAILSRRILTDSSVRFSSVTSLPTGIAAATDTGLLIYDPHSHRTIKVIISDGAALIRVNKTGDIAFFTRANQQIGIVTKSGKHWSASLQKDVTAMAITPSEVFLVGSGILTKISLTNHTLTSLPFQHRGAVTRLIVDDGDRLWYTTTSDELGYFAGDHDNPIDIASRLLTSVSGCNASVSPATN